MAQKRFKVYEAVSSMESYTYYTTEPVYETRTRKTIRMQEDAENPGTGHEPVQFFDALSSLKGDGIVFYRGYEVRDTGGNLPEVFFKDRFEVTKANTDRIATGGGVYWSWEGADSGLHPDTKKNQAEYTKKGNRGDSIDSTLTFTFQTETYQVKTGEKRVPRTGYRTVYSRGSYIQTITAEENAYPANGRSGSYWYVMVQNEAPIISGTDENLGAKNDEFRVSYSISDADSTDTLSATETLNGVVLRSLANAPRDTTQTIEITREKLFALPLNHTNTIEVKVEDGAGGVAFRRWMFTRTNSAPVISGTDQDIGEKTAPFLIDFTATDAEGDVMSAVLYLNDKALKDFETIESGEQQSFAFDKVSFAQVEHESRQKLRLEVKDRQGATAVRNVTFTRKLDKLSYMMKKETDQRVQKAIVSPTWFVAEGAIGKVEVCNNALDENPTWEEMTEQAVSNRHFNLANTSKKAEKWAMGVRITIERGTATRRSWFGGFGGAYQ